MNINYNMHPDLHNLKVYKRNISRKFKDEEGNLWGLYMTKDNHGATVGIAVFLIQGELKDRYVGELYGIDHDEWRRLVYGGLWKEVSA